MKDFDHPLTGLQVKNTIDELKKCFFRQCGIDDYAMITAVQRRVVDDLRNNQNEGLLIPTKDTMIKEYLAREDIYFICVQTPDEICAYSCTFFNDQMDYSLSCHFGNKRVATFDTVVVLPEFRGNRLHSQLLKISEVEAKRRNCEIMASTVSPDNIHSVNNFIANHFKILKQISYAELKRYIVYKYLDERESDSQE